MSVGTRFTLAINAPQPRMVNISPRMKTKMAIPRPILLVCQKRGDARELRRTPHRQQQIRALRPGKSEAEIYQAGVGR